MTAKIIALSSLMPNQISMEPGQAPLIRCAHCAQWKRVDRRKVIGHDNPELPGPDQKCDGSGQRILVDLTIEQWQERMQEGIVSAAGVTSHRVHEKPRLTSGSATKQIAGRREIPLAIRNHRLVCGACQAGRPCRAVNRLERRLQLGVHVAGCGTCQTGRHCRTGRELHNQVGLDRHRSQCTACQERQPCSPGRQLELLVRLDQHARACRHCNPGAPCRAAGLLRVEFDLAHHAAACSRCRSGAPCRDRQRLGAQLQGERTTIRSKTPAAAKS